MADVLPAVLAGGLGSLIGSFLNVMILRLPADQSLMRPRSRCPKCERPIAWYDNVPIVSWMILRGRCRHCRQPISVQYPLIEATVAGIWAGAAGYYGLNYMALTGAVFATVLVGIAITDARHYLIPDEYTWGGLLIGLLLALRDGPQGVMTAAIGAVAGFAFLYFVAWAGEKAFKQEAMGGGDIKMMAMVGAFVGWKGVFLTVFLGALLGTLVYVPLSMKKKRLVPFGVFLAVAAALTFVFGDRMIGWYLGTLV